MYTNENSKLLGLLNTVYTKLASVQNTTSPEKRTSDSKYIIERLKEAALGGISLPEVAATAKKLIKSPVAKGFGYAAGAAIPTYYVGNKLTENAAEEARNKALQTAAGVAGIGAGLYGLHRLLGPAAGGNKTASVISVGEDLQKMASAVYLDTLLDTSAISDVVGEKTAAELRQINTNYIITTLSNLLA